MTDEEFERFEREAHEYLTLWQEILKSKYKIGSYDRWDYDQETGEFVFSDKGIPKVIAKFQFVGSLSSISQTWLWSWANPSVSEELKKDIYTVKDFGENNNLSELTEEKWFANEADAWTMTCVAHKVLNAKGAYKCPGGQITDFVIFTDIQLVASE